MYRVLKFFTDLHDNDHPYHEGEVFPRVGIEVTEERLKELAGNDNKQGEPLIEEVVEEAEVGEASEVAEANQDEQREEPKEAPAVVPEEEPEPEPEEKQVKPPRVTRGKSTAKEG